MFLVLVVQFASKGFAIFAMLDSESLEPLHFELTEFSIEIDFEVAGFIVNGIQILTVYRSPAGNFELYLMRLDEVLGRLLHDRSIIVTGDFNVHFETNSKQSRSLCDLFASYGLYRTTAESTRMNACIDNIFTNINVSLYKINIVQPCLSDHLGISFECVFPGATQTKQRQITTDGLFQLYGIIESSDFSFVDAIDLDPDNKFQIFIHILTNAIEHVFPMRTRVADRHRAGAGFRVWFGDEARKSRDTLQLLVALNRQHPHLVSRQYLNDYRRTYREVLQRCKRETNTKFIVNSKNTQKAVWDLIKRSCPPQVDPKPDKLTADDFNNYFGSIADTMLATMPPAPRINQVGEQETLINKFDFTEITFNEMRNILNELKPNSTIDAYGINYKIIKCLKNVIIIPLTKLINISINAHVFPKCLKVSRVVPIYKKGLCDEVANYRPISLTPSISKIFEIALKHQISDFLESNMLLDGSQFGFRRGKSTTTAIQSLVSHIQYSFENKLYAQASLYDLSKAFDCVSHNLLIDKIRALGVGEGSVGLLESYLSDRCQYVEFNQKLSRKLPVQHGVPQGSVLGPILFLIYVNDMPTAVSDSASDSNVILFADDSCLINKSESLDDLQRRVDESEREICSWFLSNRLSLNAAKTQSLILALRKIDIVTSLEPVKYLGVHIDSRLTWEEHALQTTKKLNKTIFTIRCLKNVVTFDALIKVYYGYFCPLLQYAVLCWGHSAHASVVFGAQRRCLRVIAGLGFRECCREKFKEFGILTFPGIYIMSCLLYVRNNLKLYDRNLDNHQYGTRNGQNLLPTFKRTSTARDGVNFYGVKFFNKLPSWVQDLPFNKFKDIVKNYLLLKAFYSLDECLSDLWNI